MVAGDLQREEQKLRKQDCRQDKNRTVARDEGLHIRAFPRDGLCRRP
jgi:ribosomal protein L16/L10AE